MVHCASGISRSVAVCCAYLMLRGKIPYDKALAQIRQTRTLANPNFGFQRQLKSLENCGYDLSKAIELYEKLEKEESATDSVRNGREQANAFHSEVDHFEEAIMSMDFQALLEAQDNYIL